MLIKITRQLRARPPHQAIRRPVSATTAIPGSQLDEPHLAARDDRGPGRGDNPACEPARTRLEARRVPTDQKVVPNTCPLGRSAMSHRDSCPFRARSRVNRREPPSLTDMPSSSPACAHADHGAAGDDLPIHGAARDGVIRPLDVTRARDRCAINLVMGSTTSLGSAVHAWTD